jgi:hypothetical protein
MRTAFPLYTGQERAADYRASGARTLRSATIRSPDADDERVRQNYAACAGIEGTHAQAISRRGLRRCRYIGLAKTHLQHVITVVAVNLVRITDWQSGFPTARTRHSRFATLQIAA